jgi:hypothetical protein
MEKFPLDRMLGDFPTEFPFDTFDGGCGWWRSGRDDPQTSWGILSNFRGALATPIRTVGAAQKLVIFSFLICSKTNTGSTLRKQI